MTGPTFGIFGEGWPVALRVYTPGVKRAVGVVLRHPLPAHEYYWSTDVVATPTADDPRPFRPVLGMLADDPQWSESRRLPCRVPGDPDASLDLEDVLRALRRNRGRATLTVHRGT